MAKGRRHDEPLVEHIDPNTLKYGDVSVDPDVMLTLKEFPAVLLAHSNVVIKGQDKVAAAVFLGWSTVPCVRSFKDKTCN